MTSALCVSEVAAVSAVKILLETIGIWGAEGAAPTNDVRIGKHIASKVRSALCKIPRVYLEEKFPH
jgi:hypothetical protein